MHQLHQLEQLHVHFMSTCAVRQTDSWKNHGLENQPIAKQLRLNSVFASTTKTEVRRHLVKACGFSPDHLLVLSVAALVHLHLLLQASDLRVDALGAAGHLLPLWADL